MNILNVRYSVNRKEAFQIKTIIYEENNVKKVLKEPYTSKATSHIKNMYDNFLLLQNSKVNVVEAELIDNKIIFPFVEGDSFASKLLDAVNENDKEAFMSHLHWFKDLLEQEEQTPFYETKDFNHIFGKASELEGMPAFKLPNIDFNFDNIIITENDKAIIIDYEWIFKFPVPTEFIYYRVVMLFFNNYTWLFKDFIMKNEMLETLGISDENVIIYENMQQNFHYYASGGWVKQTENYEKSVVQQNEIVDYDSLSDVLQIFYSDKANFSEENSISISLTDTEKVKKYKVVLPTTHINAIRLDPGSKVSYVELDFKLYIDNEVINLSKHLHEHSGMLYSVVDNQISAINMNDDPQLYFYNLNLTGKKIIAEIEILYKSKNLNDILMKQIATLEDYNQRLKSENENIHIDLQNSFIKYEEKTSELAQLEQNLINAQLDMKKFKNEILELNKKLLILGEIEKERDAFKELYHHIISTKGWRILEFFRRLKF